VHHLPKVPDGAEVEAGPPHVMWPDARSGFDPSPFSPAGGARNMWALFNTFQRGRRPRRDRPPVSVLLVLLAGWLILVGLIAILVHGL
jgi:hypothetical protein